MKKKKTVGIDTTRRRFMAYFSGLGLGSTLVPGVLWGRMQDAGAQSVTLAMVTDALKLSGVEFSEEERNTMVAGANQSLTRAKAIQQFHIPNDISPPFHVSAIVPGVVVNKISKPIVFAKTPAVKVPGNLEDVAFWPIRHLSELLKTKQVSSVDLTRMYLDRLHRYDNQLLNTVTFLDELAMTQAKAADAEIAKGHFRSVLHGIPWGCKDIISVKGYPTTWGSASMKDNVPEYDASVVEMLREAGAVLLAKLTTGEMAQGANWFGGMTRNPWSVSTGSGGSSAGPGSATAAGCVGFAIGTETSGSILGPSRTCGVTGLRPTFGRVSRYGVMALGWTYDRLGPMCRYAEDCAMVMSVIARPDGRDMSISDLPFNWNPATMDIRKLKIGITGLDGPVGPEAQKMMDVLKSLGATITPFSIPNSTLPQYSDGYNYEQGAFFDEFVRAGKVEQMTNPPRGNGFKSARLLNVVDYLQMSRIRMMSMMELAKATSGFDVYFSAPAAGNRGGGGRGAPATGDAAATPAAGGGRGGRGGRGAGAAAGAGAPNAPVAPPQPAPPNNNAAGYPGVQVVTSFSEPSEAAPAGLPQGITLFGPPFKETEILFVAKSFQDAAQLHTKKPILKA
jgi:Asp-tRNA(Asn)/Glu-tRNA(Gln) amidotransferase A subunit family amidase